MECDCGAVPACPDASSPTAHEARVRTCFPEHGCSLLCNGLLLFDGGSAIAPGEESLPAFDVTPEGSPLTPPGSVRKRSRERRSQR